MKLIDLLGVLGCFLFLIKIAVHIYIKYKLDKKLDLGPSGNMLNPIFFLPIFYDAAGYLKSLKKIGNIMYIVSILLILIFVIGSNMR